VPNVTTWSFWPGPAGLSDPIIELAGGLYFREGEVLAVPDGAALIAYVRLEVEDGRPVCTSMTFERAVHSKGDHTEKGDPITSGAVASVRVDELIDAATNWIIEGVTLFSQGDIRRTATPAERAKFSKSIGRLRRARSNDDPFLDRVAAIYNAAGRAPTKAVAETAGEDPVDHRTAGRWIRLAREAGKIDPYVRSKKEAD
jgi:hypothetical protein